MECNNKQAGKPSPALFVVNPVMFAEPQAERVWSQDNAGLARASTHVDSNWMGQMVVMPCHMVHLLALGLFLKSIKL